METVFIDESAAFVDSASVAVLQAAFEKAYPSREPHQRANAAAAAIRCAHENLRGIGDCFTIRVTASGVDTGVRLRFERKCGHIIEAAPCLIR